MGVKVQHPKRDQPSVALRKGDHPRTDGQMAVGAVAILVRPTPEPWRAARCAIGVSPAATVRHASIDEAAPAASLSEGGNQRLRRRIRSGDPRATAV